MRLTAFWCLILAMRKPTVRETLGRDQGAVPGPVVPLEVPSCIETRRYPTMATQRVGIGLLGVLLTAGCIPCFHPIYSESDTVKRDGIIGRWIDSQGTQTWHFQHADGDGYSLVLVEGGEENRFDVHLTEIGGQLFMDLFPAGGGETRSGFARLHRTPMHTFYQVNLTDASLGLSFLQPQWLKQHRAELAETLPHVQRDEHFVLITAETPRLRQFISYHMDVEGAFSNPFLLTKVRDR